MIKYSGSKYVDGSVVSSLGSIEREAPIEVEVEVAQVVCVCG